MLSFVLHAQNNTPKFDLSAGISNPETFNIGGRFHYNNTGRFDIKLGTNFNFDDIYYSATLNHCWYFGAPGKKTNHKMWGFNSAYTLSFVNNEHREGYASFLSFFFSREFRIVYKLFIEPELGITIPVFNNTYIKDEHYEGYNIPLFPKFGINVVYKL